MKFKRTIRLTANLSMKEVMDVYLEDNPRAVDD